MKTPKILAAVSLLALLIGALYAATGGKSTPPAEDGDAPPIRIVTTGHAPVAQLRDQLEPQLLLCRTKLGLPAEPLGMPSDAALARVASTESEELFDGPRYAQYEITRNLLPDDKDGCQVKVLQQFSVKLETSCDRQWTARAGALDFDVEPMKSEELVHSQDEAMAKASPCSARNHMSAETLAALKKTSRQPAGLGVQCQWSTELDLHIAEALTGTKAAEEDPLSGSCYYADLPEYPYTSYQGNPRSVSVQMRMPHRAGDTFRPPGIAVGILDQRLKDFSIGTAIPAGRFSHGQAEAFVKQPAIVPLEAPKK